MQLGKGFEHPDMSQLKDGPVKAYLRGLNTALANQQRRIHNDLNQNFIHNLKSGATQAAAGAAKNERWYTSGHATLPDNVLMIGA